MTLPLDTARGSASLTFAVPEHDADEFAALPARVQREARERLAAMRTILAARSLNAGALEVSRSMNGATGWSAARLRAQAAAYARSGDWRHVLNRAKAGATHWHRDAMPDVLAVRENVAFVEHVRARFERNQRVSRRAWLDLVEQWKRWRAGDRKAAIPGYQDCPPPDIHGRWPRGWSYGNLMSLAPDRADLVAARIGSAAARDFAPSVFTTRYGLKLGQFVQFDDMEFDLKVNYPGQLKAMRPRGFFAIDVLSAYDVGMSWKPTLWDEEEEKKRTLTEQDFLWFAISYLMDRGYRTDDVGTTLIWEHGTATVRDREFLRSLELLTEGRCKPATSGMIGQEQMAGLFEGRSKGNFRFKSLREGAFALFHNQLASLPGQVGKDRDHSPEQLHGLEAANTELLKLVPSLAPERAEQIGWSLLSWQEFSERATDLLAGIANRTDHKIEGWERCGFTTAEWRMAISDSWRDEAAFAALPEAARHAMALVLRDGGQELRRVRRMSPREVWASRAHELTRLRPDALPVLLAHRAQELGREVTVRRGIITVEDRLLGPDPVRFYARDTRRGNRTPLNEGDKFLAFINPHAPSHAILCDARLKVMAVAPYLDTPCRGDAEAVGESMGRQRGAMQARRDRQDARHAPFAAEHVRMLAHNAAIRTGGPVTLSERRAAADEQTEAERLQRLADDAFAANAD